MKSYEEMAESVLKSVNEHKIKKNTRNEILKRAIPLCCMGAVLVTGIVVWSSRGYSVPVNSQGEETSAVTQGTQPQNGAAETDTSPDDVTTTAAESKPTDMDISDANLPSSEDVSAKYMWRCLRYEEGAWYYKLTRVSESDLETIKRIEKETEIKILNEMDEAERALWSYRIGIAIAIMENDDYVAINSLDEWYLRISERNLEDGTRCVFYKNEEDFRNEKWTETGILEEGAIMKIYIKENIYNPPTAADSPWIIAEQLQKIKTVGELKELPYLDQVSVYVYSDGKRKAKLEDTDSIVGIKNIIIDYVYDGVKQSAEFQASDDEPVWYSPVVLQSYN